MADGESFDDRNLYRRGGSPCWWLEVIVDGKRLRRSTRCRDIAAARAFRDHYIESIRSRFVSDEWRAAVTADSGNPRGWIRAAYSRLRSRSRRKALSEHMTYDELVQLLLGSNGVCAVTGLRLSLNMATKLNPWRASLDRIECAKGYTTGNCRIVCMILNIGMNAWGLDTLQILARAMVGKELCGQSIPTAENLPTVTQQKRRQYRLRKQ